jgi:hypothetical protein
VYPLMTVIMTEKAVPGSAIFTLGIGLTRLETFSFPSTHSQS